MLQLSPETEWLARKLAGEERTTPEAVIHAALETRLRDLGLSGDGVRRQVDTETFAARQALTDAFVAKLAAMPVLDPRSPKEIMDDLDPL